MKRPPTTNVLNTPPSVKTPLDAACDNTSLMHTWPSHVDGVIA